MSDAKHEIMNDSIERYWLAVRRTIVFSVLIVRRFLFKLLINRIAYA